MENHKKKLTKELIYWLFFGFFLTFLTIFISQINLIDDVIIDLILYTTMPTIILIFPVLFKLIYGKYPVEYLNYRKLIKEKEEEEEANWVDVDLSSLNEDTYLEKCIDESKSISEKIYNLSRAYLLIGCSIAAFGVIIFYFSVYNYSKTNEINEIILNLLPRLGALFFIEFIAFFFLKQYRIMLEEYRYYESIKRKRQENFIFLSMIEKYENKPELLKIIKDFFSQSNSGKLIRGETTEIIETQKIVNSDMDLFAKMTELVKLIKSK